MFAGVDVGCTLTKIAYQDFRGEIELTTVPSGDWRRDPYVLDPVSIGLRDKSVRVVCVSGAGAEAFARSAVGWFSMVVPQGDEVSREIVSQAEGVRELLRSQGEDADEFLLVSVGSGVSFTRVSRDIIAQYEPGLSVGGKYVVAQAALVGVKPEDIGEMAAKGTDSDLLMKHVFRKVGYPKGEFVVASLGRLGQDVPATPENVCAGAIKTVATCTAGHIIGIMKNPDWAWQGPAVFIGTPVSEFAPLQEWLRVFSLGLGLKGVFPADGQYACALGALHHAVDPGGTVPLLPPAGALKRLGAGIGRRAKLIGALLKRR